MIQLVSSCLLPPETHLNSFYVRRGDEWQQFWTLPWMPGASLRDVPLYVLCSGNTFSAAEEFCYNMRNLGHATLVGETTGGGAHPVADHVFDLGEGVWLEMRVPYGRAVNPVSGTNWEGTGVTPHLDVPAAAALDRALLDWYDKSAADPVRAGGVAWARAATQVRLEPVSLDAARLRDYVGRCGPRELRLVDGRLEYQREGGARMSLKPMAADLFATELDWFRLRFERDGRDRVCAVAGLYENGQEDRHPRD